MDKARYRIQEPAGYWLPSVHGYVDVHQAPLLTWNEVHEHVAELLCEQAYTEGAWFKVEVVVPAVNG